MINYSIESGKLIELQNGEIIDMFPSKKRIMIYKNGAYYSQLKKIYNEKILPKFLEFCMK